MNTKTMRLPPRRVLTSNKRKDFEGFDSLKPSPPAPSPSLSTLAKPVLAPPPQSKKLAQAQPVSSSSNQLLAGYLAHEYLTKGTLLGQPWDPVRPSQAVEPNNNNNKKIKLSHKGGEAEPLSKEHFQRYVEVCNLLKGEEGAHLTGVFNPSQLARFLQM